MFTLKKDIKNMRTPTRQPSAYPREIALRILFLLGAFSIGYNLAIAFHETGHVIMYPLAGEKMTEFVLNPFSWSWAAGKNLSVPVLWGGVTLGLFFALIPLLLSMFIRSPLFRYLSRILASCAFLINGIYLAMGTLFGFGDGGDLVYTGASPIFIVGLGSLYILLSLVFWSHIQYYLGLDHKSPFRQRTLILFGGIAPYMAIIFLYNLIHNPTQLSMWGGLSIAGLIMAFLISLCGHLQSRFFPQPRNTPDLSHHYALPVLIFALLVILIEFTIFGMPDNPF